MTATHAGQSTDGDALAPGATLGGIRTALLPEDWADFDAAYTAALDIARTHLDLTELFDVLERWRRVAVLQRDPEDLRRTAELTTGEPARTTNRCTSPARKRASNICAVYGVDIRRTARCTVAGRVQGMARPLEVASTANVV